ncbi:sel1 repeat family protein [Allochromatium humboldtianum]|uniref:Sel1 repeat family protein n=1 Tax=Allochromatium humboldtianum TaxID=504901 RepID=A0A850RBX9_9GAMM|nr:sel1 repeat family protein [Allochromatium humboldtianum]NVZ08757.1 sel1 repeat family protein [Allochromatium humboldtianum]
MKQSNCDFADEEVNELIGNFFELELIDSLCDSLEQTIHELAFINNDESRNSHLEKAKSGNSRSMLILAFWDFQEKKSITIEGKKLLEKAADLDPSFYEAKYAIEMINSEGKPLLFKDKLEEFARNLPQAQFDLGKIYEKNIKDALKLYNAAAKSHYLYAQERLGDISFDNGNYKDAARWYSMVFLRSKKTGSKIKESVASYKLANSYFLAYSTNQLMSNSVKKSSYEAAIKRYQKVAKSEFGDRSVRFKSALILLTLYFEKEIDLPTDEIKCFFDVVAEYVLSDFSDGKVNEILNDQYDNLEIDIKKTGRSLIAIRQWIYFQEMLNQKELNEQDGKIKKLILEVVEQFKEKDKINSIYYDVTNHHVAKNTPPKKIAEIFNSLLYCQQSQKGGVEFKWETLLGKIANVWDSSNYKEINKFIDKKLPDYKQFPDRFAYAWILQNFRHLMVHYKNEIEASFPGYSFLAFILLVFKKATFNCSMDSEIDNQLLDMIGLPDEDLNSSSVEHKIQESHIYISKKIAVIEKDTLCGNIQKISNVKHPNDIGWTYAAAANFVASYEYKYGYYEYDNGDNKKTPLDYFYVYIFSSIIFGKQKNRYDFQSPIIKKDFDNYLCSDKEDIKFISSLAKRIFSYVKF